MNTLSLTEFHETVAARLTDKYADRLIELYKAHEEEQSRWETDAAKLCADYRGSFLAILIREMPVTDLVTLLNELPVTTTLAGVVDTVFPNERMLQVFKGMAEYAIENEAKQLANMSNRRREHFLLSQGRKSHARKQSHDITVRVPVR